jgi:hypothetical protein
MGRCQGVSRYVQGALLTFNQGVMGSNPIGLTKSANKCNRFWATLQRGGYDRFGCVHAVSTNAGGASQSAKEAT